MIFNNALGNSWWTQHLFWGKKKKRERKKKRNLKYLPFTCDDLARSLRGLGAFLS